MDRVLQESADKLPSAIDIDGPGERLATSLLSGKLIRYTDARFQVSSGEYHYIFKLVQDAQRFILIYVQIPFIYPMPDEMKTSIKTELEALLESTIEIEFLNAGTQAQKHDVEQSASMAGD